MLIDFERAEIVKSRRVLGDISPNRKRKRSLDAIMVKRGEEKMSVFARERRRALNGLRALTIVAGSSITANLVEGRIKPQSTCLPFREVAYQAWAHSGQKCLV
ncbi:hypothetical protein BU24DRAFT_173048 [Aaosphaeria arxii CBS 175.79]|uniref:Uncharacterized protein n=1 Tax=Aaosphaeria arxii CBS 175.79 TaxID=1450172 RepID=A0A6A5X646_9PLEO|nr:uncharacterized protein BU24DRAFT_173048 [Aaosphaeria arxii CBS 175.79]KAF2008264.1 hypothetical protein BU24DRAFT_173048 [Aaosphaeria arxii CBS 175.79]